MTIHILRRCFERSSTRQPIRVYPLQTLTLHVDGVARFVSWYNTEHRHSAIRYVTPDQRHTGADVAILARRRALYERARRRTPARWSGTIRNWTSVSAVVLNPEPTAKEFNAAS
jgi:hypothetical protein